MIFGLIEPGRKLSEAYLTQADTAKNALKQFEDSFPGLFYKSAFFFVRFNDVGTVAHDMRILKYLPKKRPPRIDYNTKFESDEIKEYTKRHKLR